jgi:hypothetical protein
MVRIHARQPSSTEADLRAIGDLQKLDTETAVIRLLSGFPALLASLTANVRTMAHIDVANRGGRTKPTKFFYFQ